MKTSQIIFLLTTCFLAFAGGCQLDDDGPTISKNFNLTGFEKIDLGDALDLDITVGDHFKITAAGSEDDVNALVLEVQNGTLKSHFQPGNENRSGVKLSIEVPALVRLRLHSATQTTYRDPLHREAMEIELDGAAALDAQIDYENLDLVVSGASRAKLKGQVDNLTADVRGASKLFAEQLGVQVCAIIVSGKSEALVWVSEQLTGQVNGKSQLTYRGSPNSVDVDVAADSQLIKH